MAGQEWRQNPALVIPREWFEFVDLWGACRDADGGIATWPDAPAAINHQAAWIVEAFQILAAAADKLREERRNIGRV